MRNAYNSPYDDEDMYAPPKRKPTPRRKQTLQQKALDVARRNPRRVVAGVLLASIASVISLNALVMQTSRHPAPMFAAAPAPVQSAAAVPMQPPPRPVETQATAPAPAAASPAASTQAEAPAPAQRDVIGDIIRTGSTTPVSAQLSRNANASSAQPVRVAAAPVPAMRVVAAPQPPHRRDAIGDIIRSNTGATAQPLATSAADDIQKRKIASVQQALTKLKYGPLPASGVMGPATQDAIRRFEFDRRLPVTGKLNPQTLAELAATARVAIR